MKKLIVPAIIAICASSIYASSVTGTETPPVIAGAAVVAANAESN